MGLPGKYSGPPLILWISNCIFNDGFRRNATANEGLAGLIYPTSRGQGSTCPGENGCGGGVAFGYALTCIRRCLMPEQQFVNRENFQQTFELFIFMGYSTLQTLTHFGHIYNTPIH